MSDPTRTQRRSGIRTSVRVRRNFQVLPPILTNNLANDASSEISQSSLSLRTVDLKCETPIDDDRDFPTRFREDLKRSSSFEQKYRRDQNSSSKVIRIFVSSTFTDFFNEREILIKKVFPELRDRLEIYGIQIIDCDLRWGVPKDSTTEQTILTCMEEIDRCHEENEQPFFIGLISDKYGWVPKRRDLPKEITERYRWLDGASITLMEFLHGALRSRNPNALFLIRNSEKIFSDLPEKYFEKFRDRDETNREHLKFVKTELEQFFPSEQIYHYDCFYGGLHSSTGRERVKIDGLNDFERKTTIFLEKAIQNWYPELFMQEGTLNVENQQMKNFLSNKIQFYVDRPKEFETLLKFILNEHQLLNFHQGTQKPPENENIPPVLLVRGRPGDGKTILLSKFVKHIEETMDDQFILYYHFLDAQHPLNFNDMIFKNCSKVLYKYLESNDLLSDENGVLSIDDTSLFDRALKLIKIPLLIIIDGLEKGDFRRSGNYYEYFPISNFESLKNQRVFIVLSCETNGRLNEIMQSLNHFHFQLEPWTIEQRRIYVEKFFHRYNKTLEPQQIELLLNNQSGEYPLYLTILCENLRQFGDYSLVTKRLNEYPEKIEQLLNFLLNEIYEITENRLIIDAFFKFLLISDVGLIESDIVNLLEFYFEKKTNNDEPTLVNFMIWSKIRRYIKLFLDVGWIFGQQSIILRHGLLEKTLLKRLFNDKSSEEIRTLHGSMADFFQKSPSTKIFAIRQIPFHLEKAGMYKEMIDYLRSTNSRGVPAQDRRTFLHKRRCSQRITQEEGMLSQRAYLCNVCAMQFKLGPFTMAKSSCAICTNMILGNFANDSVTKREARLCMKHGSQGYPSMIQCFLCRATRIRPTGKTLTIVDPVPLNICLQCFLQGSGMPRCCALETNEQ